MPSAPSPGSASTQAFSSTEPSPLEVGYSSSDRSGWVIPSRSDLFGDGSSNRFGSSTGNKGKRKRIPTASRDASKGMGESQATKVTTPPGQQILKMQRFEGGFGEGYGASGGSHRLSTPRQCFRVRFL
ncbi:hypothetical protein GIB67_026634 [Kingdonia uniflora]|uniref:Uncharacterized protein n=1 Tax=Kingdonia uniflora TaxID=39325 RepID=A0A7J7NI36_9MAGN|nr:hypothetical protein GIB67_026634 [Kingdonia uniflora]